MAGLRPGETGPSIFEPRTDGIGPIAMRCGPDLI